MFRHFPNHFPAIFGFTGAFEATPKNRPFFVFLAPAPRRKRILGYSLVCLYRQMSGLPANTNRDYASLMPVASLPISFMSKLKKIGIVPTCPASVKQISHSKTKPTSPNQSGTTPASALHCPGFSTGLHQRQPPPAPSHRFRVSHSHRAPLT